MAKANTVQSDNPAALKHDIDSGLTGDKIGGFDPAAAPLGTDAEAGGTPPSPGEVAQARKAERAAEPSRTRNAAEPELQPDGHVDAGRHVFAGVMVGIAAAVVLAILLWVTLF